MPRPRGEGPPSPPKPPLHALLLSHESLKTAKARVCPWQLGGKKRTHPAELQFHLPRQKHPGNEPCVCLFPSVPDSPPRLSLQVALRRSPGRPMEGDAELGAPRALGETGSVPPTPQAAPPAPVPGGEPPSLSAQQNPRRALLCVTPEVRPSIAFWKSRAKRTRSEVIHYENSQGVIIIITLIT